MGDIRYLSAVHENGIFLNEWVGGDATTLIKAFGLSKRELAGAEILLASYTRADFRGEAFVLLMRDGVLYEVNARHDSSDGFHGQWEPEDTLIEALRHRIENGLLGRSERGINLFADELQFLLTELELERR